MMKRNIQWLLAVVALAPTALAAQKVTVPEGGSTVLYIIGAVVVCAGAMFLRSRFAKPTKA